jgi:hypothetical protein
MGSRRRPRVLMRTSGLSGSFSALSGTFSPDASLRGDHRPRSSISVWVEHGKSGCPCDLARNYRLWCLDPHCRLRLQRTRVMDLPRPHHHTDRASERLRSNLENRAPCRLIALADAGPESRQGRGEDWGDRTNAPVATRPSCTWIEQQKASRK